MATSPGSGRVSGGAGSKRALLLALSLNGVPPTIFLESVRFHEAHNCLVAVAAEFGIRLVPAIRIQALPQNDWLETKISLRLSTTFLHRSQVRVVVVKDVLIYSSYVPGFRFRLGTAVMLTG